MQVLIEFHRHAKSVRFPLTNMDMSFVALLGKYFLTFIIKNIPFIFQYIIMHANGQKSIGFG
jgi:hypothetical protein